MKTKKEVIEIIKILKDYYPDATCSLDFKNPFEITIAVMLSAQCTDERVNKTTPQLFAKYGTPEDMSKADLSKLEEIIYPCGFYKNKAKNMKACAEKLIKDFDGVVPNNIEKLQLLPGVGRKSANVIMLEAFHNPQGIAVDTHVKRITKKIGLSNNTDPKKIEQDLLKIIPREYYYDVNHLLVWHGRKMCNARKPYCKECPINSYCDTYKKEKKGHYKKGGN